MDDARRVVQTRFAMHFDGARPYTLSQILLPVAQRRHLARAYEQAGRDRRAYLLIAPVAALLLGLRKCQDLAPMFQIGMADYLALAVLFNAEPRYWPSMWEAQTSGEPARMVAGVAATIPAFRTAAAEAYLRGRTMPVRDALNGYLRTEMGFAAVNDCFGAGAAPRAERLSGLLRFLIAIDGQDKAGKRA